MIFSINNGEYTVWLPIYTLNDEFYDSYFYRGLLVLELFLSIFTCLIVATSGYIIVTTKAFHTNMNSLFAFFVLSWISSAIGRSLLTPYIIGTWIPKGISSDYRSWWTDNPEEMTPISSISDAWPLFIGGIFTWYYMIVMTTCLFAMSLERTFASFFIRNYENTSRLYLLFGLLLFHHFIIFTAIYFLYFNLIHFVPAVLLLMVLNIVAMGIYYGNRHYNRKIIRRFKKEPVESVRHYTLPVRFQAKENLRVFNLTVRVFVVGFIFISLGISLIIIVTFKWIPSLDTFLTLCFESIVHLNPLIICPVLIFSVSTWSKALLHSRLPMIDKITKITFIDLHPQLPNQTQQQETETYFTQLQSVWEHKT